MSLPIGLAGFDAVRAEFGLPAAAFSHSFPDSVLAEAERAAAYALTGEGGDVVDATDIALVTIDPPGARDLDQAMQITRFRGGFRVHHAIADLGAVVPAGGALDAEARRRGQTLYLPDGRIPLYPPRLCESSVSLQPEQVRRAVLWTIDLDPDGQPADILVHRALVRSVAQLDYPGVQRGLAEGSVHASLEPLPELGRMRRELAVQRGALALQLPRQRIVPDGDGWRLGMRLRTDVEAWSAEISLLTGMCAAQLMLNARVGVLRTVAAPAEDDAESLRHSAVALGLDWPEGAAPATVLADLDNADPRTWVLMAAATRTLRGAGYTTFDGDTPAGTFHGGIGAPYAHVTSPMRRLVDRFGSEVCLAVSAGEPVPEWVRAALSELPGLMAASEALAATVEQSYLAQAEARLLAERAGESFPAVVLQPLDDGASREIFLPDLAVTARCAGDGLSAGQHITVRVAEADPATRTVVFAPV
ncbi:MAG: RNB domain-containing ribonuclease [Pseudonocardiaceae bacterium]